MSYSPHVQARIAQAKHKKDQQLRQMAVVSFRRGVVGAAKCASALANHPLAKIYDLQSLIMWKMKILASEDRLLLGTDPKVTLEVIVDNARTVLGESPSEEDLITASVAHARSEHEAWKLHFQLSGVHQAALPAERKSKIAAAIASRFPAGADEDSSALWPREYISATRLSDGR